MKIKSGDTVQMRSGKDRGKQGKVVRAVPRLDKVVVEGLNMVKKHIRPKKQGQSGEVVSIARAVPVSVVQLVCPKCARPVRVGYRLADNKKERVCKKCGTILI